MIMWAQVPIEALEDCFRPPPEACLVRCIHCGRMYSSDEIVWRESETGGFWRCPMEGCDGAGFGFDIFPIADEEADEDDEWDEYEDRFDGE